MGVIQFSWFLFLYLQRPDREIGLLPISTISMEVEMTRLRSAEEWLDHFIGGSQMPVFIRRHILAICSACCDERDAMIRELEGKIAELVELVHENEDLRPNAFTEDENRIE
jgi:hypothetical protein